jgi:XTP/dITP diphosphohydrolase
MRSIVLATSNKGKIREISERLEGPSFSILTLDDFPELVMPPEDGVSFKENALIKARCAADISGQMALSDDSGLEVRGLGGAPGILSARYAGAGATDEENIEKLIKETGDMSEEDRSARFLCALALVEPAFGSKGRSAKESFFEGTLDGIIIPERRGVEGFGYDPIFFIPELKKTAAELTKAEKNQISHRGRALDKLWAYLQGLLRG